MRVVFYLNSLSPHQIPLAKEIAMHVGEENFLYLYRDLPKMDRQVLGWDFDGDFSWCEHGNANDCRVREADIVYTGIRCFALLEERARKNKKTLYYSERWFKPFSWHFWLFGRCFRLRLPGWLRMLIPQYRKMVNRFVAWANDSDSARVLAVGPWAKEDFLKMGVTSEKIIEWGYFVAPSKFPRHKCERQTGMPLKVLWVGRMIEWKRVDTLIRAVQMISNVEVTLVGDGPEKLRLMRLAQKLPIIFKDSQPINKIRTIMREHDVYVLCSDEGEGWGAALNEALEEGLTAVGTYEAGSSAAMLPASQLYHAGDYVGLAKILGDLERRTLEDVTARGIGVWSARFAGRKVLEV